MLLLYIIHRRHMTEKKLKSVYNKIKTSNVYDVATKTPLDFATNLSKKLNNEIFIKRDDLQPVFSFKLRGAYHKISKLKKNKNIGHCNCGISRQSCSGSCYVCAKISNKCYYCYAYNNA
jgi:tryptophan synthase beta subunit